MLRSFLLLGAVSIIPLLNSIVSAKTDYFKPPKTKTIRGYFKKNGTFVPPYFRSPPKNVR